MNKIISYLKFLIVVLGILMTAEVSAQASRTWVSGVGDDANPCSRTAPCKTFAGAISKTAAGGEIDALDPAGYGALTITKAITIDGGGGQVASVLVSGTNGIVVLAGASDTVILRNLRLNGLTTGIDGIRFLSGLALHVENCNVFGFNNGLDVAVNQGSNASVVVQDSTFNHMSGRALNLDISGGGNLAATFRGIVAKSSTDGVVTTSSAVKLSMSGSTISNMIGVGVRAQLGFISADGNLISGNTTGVQADSGATLRISNNGIYDNNTGIIVNGGIVASAANNRLGNTTNGGPPNGAITVQ